MEEVFKIIMDFPAYRISNMGRIQSRWKRGSFYSEFKIKDVWKDLPTHANSKGYLQVHLCDGYGKIKTVRIHKLVAELFLGEMPEGKQLIRHLDNDPSNNCVTNLAYGTYIENENDKIEHRTWNSRYGGSKISFVQAQEIRMRLLSGEKQNSLAKEFCVSRPTINRIGNNKIWRDNESSDRV